MASPITETNELTQLIKEQNYQQAVEYLFNSENLGSSNASVWFVTPRKENNTCAHLWDEFLIHLADTQNSDVEFCIKGIITAFINQDIYKNNLKQTLTYLRPVLSRPYYSPHIVDSILKKYPLNEAADALLKSLEINDAFYEVLFKEALRRYNVYLLQELKKSAPILFAVQMNTLNENESARLEQLLQIPEDKMFWFSNYMQPLAHGFDFLGEQEILLVLAQIKNRKTYVFDPVLLKNDECLDFFTTLQQNYPIQKRFIISGSHFCYGEIQIDTEGRAKLWLCDSVGNTKESTHSKYLNDFIFNFAELFPENTIYLAKEKRQNSPQGCAVFAVDDAMHCYTLRLPAGLNDIWDYFSALINPEKATFINNDTDSSLIITLCPLPLSLLRTMQSKSLYDEVIPGRALTEQNLIINKRGKTAKESSQKFFKSTPQGERNTRLEYKLEKMAQYTCGFLIKCVSDEDVKRLRHEFTLETFKQNAAKESEEYQQKIPQSPAPKV